MKKDEEEKFDIEEKTPEQLAFERDEREQFADGYSLTDAGNKLRFRGMNQDDLRFNYDCGRWMVWDGKRL